MSEEDPIDVVTSALEELGSEQQGSDWQCPNHDDRNPSLTVKDRGDGVVLIRCGAGCPTKEVLGRLGLSWADLYPEDLRHPMQSRGGSSGQVVRTAPHPASLVPEMAMNDQRMPKRIASAFQSDSAHEYLQGHAVSLEVAEQAGLFVDEEGRLIFPLGDWWTARSLKGQGPRWKNASGPRPPLFPSPRVESSRVVGLVESPSDALALASAGLPSFASLGSRLNRAALPSLQGREVILFPHNDRPQAETGAVTGEEWLADAFFKLRGVASVLSLVRMPPGGDFASSRYEYCDVAEYLARAPDAAIALGLLLDGHQENSAGADSMPSVDLRLKDAPAAGLTEASSPEEPRGLQEIDRQADRALPPAMEAGLAREGKPWPWPVDVDWIEGSTRDIEYVHPPYLPAGVRLIAVGPAGAGKSMWALYVACHLSQRGIPVAYFSQENPAQVDQSRLRRMRPDLRHLRFFHGEDVDLSIQEQVGSVMERLREELARIQKEAIRSGQEPPDHWGLIVLDTLTGCWSGDENENAAVTALDRQALVPLVHETGATLLVIHHTGHPGERRRTGAAAPRGASAIGQKFDVVLEFKQEGPSGFEISCNRWQRIGPEPPRTTHYLVVDTRDDGLELATLDASSAGGGWAPEAREPGPDPMSKEARIRLVADAMVEAVHRFGPLSSNAMRKALQEMIVRAGVLLQEEARAYLLAETPPRLGIVDGVVKGQKAKVWQLVGTAPSAQPQVA